MFVDQFEETFTAGADRGEQEEFIGRLLDLVDRPDTAVVLAIRADHLGRCATFPELADRLTGNDVLVGPMRDSELRRTVELPAQRAGLEIEPGLVEVIVGDVAGRAGALPLLSTALAETWERREARALTLAGYRAAGGVNGALARMAEDAYAALPAGPRAAARRLLLRLCDAGDEGDLSLRRRLPVAEAADEHDADARAALETLADRRLLTIDSDAVEVAHEALLREWPRLRTWLDEDVQGRRLHRRLHDAARSWEAAGHDPSELYRGTRLSAASDWATSHDDELSHAEGAFLGFQPGPERTGARRCPAPGSRSRPRQPAAPDPARGHRHCPRRRPRRGLRRCQSALRCGRPAGPRRTRRAAWRPPVSWLPPPTPTWRSTPSAASCWRSPPSSGPAHGDGSVLPEAEEALHRAVTASRIELRVPGVGGRLDWSPDGTVFVTEGPEGSGMVDIRDARTGESVRSFRGHDGDIIDVAFNHDGTLLATTGTDGTARIWDPATGEECIPSRAQTTTTWGAWGPSFSPDGSLFAAAWPGRRRRQGPGPREPGGSSGRSVRSRPRRRTSFDPTSTRLAIASLRGEPMAVVVDVESGDDVFTLEGHRSPAHGRRLEPRRHVDRHRERRRQRPHLRRRAPDSQRFALRGSRGSRARPGLEP